MKIKKISITDFKGIVGTLELDFTGSDGSPLDLIVLTGPNGCGKTSVLEACVISSIKKYLLGGRADSLNNIRKGKERAAIHATFWTKNEIIEFSHILYMNQDHSQAFISFGDDFKSEFGPYFNETPIVYFSSWRGPNLPDGVELYDNGKEQDNQITEPNRLSNIIEIITHIVATRAFEGYDPSNPDLADEIMRRINTAWKLFYPERINDFFIPKPQGKKRFNIFLNKPDFQEIIPVDALSSGEIEIFTLLGWFAINDFSNGIVLIDEPELHLHPAWQRIIIPALREIQPEAQFVVATHSPQVLSSVKPHQIRLLEHGDKIIADIKNAGREAGSPSESYGLDTNRILEDIMGVPDRPKDIKDKFKQLFLAIDKNDLEDAHTILMELYNLIQSDPELVKAETLIRRKETIRK